MLEKHQINMDDTRFYTWRHTFPDSYETFKIFTHFEDEKLKILIVDCLTASFEYWSKRFILDARHFIKLQNSALLLYHAKLDMKVKLENLI